MKIKETPVTGCFEVHIEKSGDDRGFFARSYCEREFANYGIEMPIKQTSLSFSASKGTTRGMHFQCNPAMEGKLVRCIKGSIFDVMVDIRVNSPTFGHWFGMELSEKNNAQLYSTKGFAHGFQTLTDNALVSYQIDEFYEPGLTSGFAWNDPEIAVKWPLEPTVQSDRDRALPDLYLIPLQQLLPYSPD